MWLAFVSRYEVLANIWKQLGGNVLGAKRLVTILQEVSGAKHLNNWGKRQNDVDVLDTSCLSSLIIF